ncbi:DUF4245 domain-containing protein [Salipaludibacillus sp. LMS25]|jgi:hypothetical protein|uniref:DUF4245 domain-containing protein n=1 Tax=Salipaludibacillus sp. LMS25 TaxID=2924031 RepID=UPI0020D04041|nr:DUF4245 domain-containing protein [Salipaludibacillus sp. LMS25]UTR14120.1 DUF4245 domain-containing protein [Salipaludibacillus sp. LMS25]
MTINGLLKNVMTILLVVLLASCVQTDSTLTQAREELPFPVLYPEEIPDGWAVNETIYEDRLLVIIFNNNQEGQIELVQDQNIQGLDVDELRSHVLSNVSVGSEFLLSHEVVEVGDYVGELAYFTDPISTLQYTFVEKNELFNESVGPIPYYQVIGKGVSSDELKEFIHTLEVST